MAGQSQRTFLSYARADVAFARELRDWLLAQGHEPWMDLFDIPAGARWPTEIDRALKSSQAVIGMLSPGAVQSDNVLNEWDWAIANGRTLILLLIEPCEVPFHYVSRNYIDFTSDREAGYTSLAAALAQGTSRQEKPGGALQPTAADTQGTSAKRSHAFSAPRSNSRLQQAMSRQQAAPLLVGREQEQNQLQEQLDQAIGGKGSLLLVGGEAGIGKTTLISWLQARAENQGALVLSGGCYDLTTTPPYGPWSEILQRYPSEDDLPVMPAEIRDDTGLASIPSQAALFEIVGEFFAEVSEQRPLLLILEDLHWTDPASLDFLRFFARYVGGLPILIVATYREDEITRRHQLTELMPVLIREAPVHRVSLHRLDNQAIRTLVSERCSLAASEMDQLVAYLERLAEGNPFFTEELLRSLQEDGQLWQENGTWRLNELKAADVPPLVRQVIERRFARLGSSTHDLLAIAAVIGHDVPYDVWMAVAGIAEEQLVAAIEQAVDARLILESADGRGMSFSHALVREALYSGLVALRRQSWHRAAADELISSSSTDPDVIAHHLEQGNDPRLATWLMAAGERAQRRHAWIMAAERFNRAQQLLEHDAGRARERGRLLLRIGLLVRYNDEVESLAYLDEAQRLASETGDQVTAAEARTHRGLVLGYRGHIREALKEMKAGLAILDELRLASPELEDWRDDPMWRPILGVQGWSTLALWLGIAGRFREARTILESSRGTSAVESNTPDYYRALALVYYNAGEFAEARKAAQRSAEAYLKLGDLWQAGRGVQFETNVLLRFATDQIDLRREVAASAHDIWSDAAAGSVARWSPQFAYLGEWFVSGNWQSIRELVEEHLDDLLLERSATLNFSLIDGGLPAAFARHLYGVEFARKLVDKFFSSGPVSEPSGHRYSQAIDLLLLGANTALDVRDLPGAHVWLDAFESWFDWSGSRLWRAEASLVWARYHHLNGDLATARQRAEQALAEASEPRQPLVLIASQRFLGKLDVDESGYESASRHLEAALELASACEAPFERALTLFEVVGLHLATGKIEAARSLLAEVRAICEPLKAGPTLERVSALESRLDSLP